MKNVGMTPISLQVGKASRGKRPERKQSARNSFIVLDSVVRRCRNYSCRRYYQTRICPSLSQF
jgi:hypothetical protein